MMSDRDDAFDVIIAGGGFAGLTAAIAAVELGLRAVVFEAAATAGGATTDDARVWVGNNALARKAGIADDDDAVRAYVAFLAAGQGVAERMDAWIAGAPAALDFFRRAGVPFTLMSDAPDDLFGRAPGALAAGRLVRVPDLKSAVLEEVRRRDVALITSARAVRLCIDAGRVSGVLLADGRTFRADRVVLATGGYASDATLTSRFEDIPGLRSVFPPTVAGDGLRMGGSAGGRVHLVRNNMAVVAVGPSGGYVAADAAALRTFDAATRSFTQPLDGMAPALVACSAGLAADAEGRVLNWHGGAVPGLYAIGDAAAHDEFGAGYQTGSSLSSAMTFALRAAQHIASEVRG
jgi:succinate dehydrogenase/fumarate reductase flavoprotein subunit